MALTSNRNALMEAVQLVLLSSPYWPERVDVNDSADALPAMYALPLVIVHPLGTEIQVKTSKQKKMTFKVGITVYQDNNEGSWTLQGIGESLGLLEMQEKVMEMFYASDGSIIGTLDGIASAVWTSEMGPPELGTILVKSQTMSALRATNVLTIEVEPA